MDQQRTQHFYTHDACVRSLRCRQNGILLLHDKFGTTVLDIVTKHVIRKYTYKLCDVLHSRHAYVHGNNVVVQLPSKKYHANTFDNVHALEWSPDGARLAALTLDEVHVFTGPEHVHYDMPRFMQERHLPPDQIGVALAWSPCSTMLAVMRCRTKCRHDDDHVWRAWVWSVADGMIVQQWRRRYRSFNASTPLLSWSPDSKHIVTSQGEVLDLAGGERRIETGGRHIAWSPGKGKWIASTGHSLNILFRADRDMHKFAWIDFGRAAMTEKRVHPVAWLDDETIIFADGADLYTTTLREWSDRTNWLFPKKYRERVFAQMCVFHRLFKRMHLEVWLIMMLFANN